MNTTTNRLLIALTLLASTTGLLFVGIMYCRIYFGSVPGPMVLAAFIYTVLSFAILILLIGECRRNRRLKKIKLDLFGLREDAAKKKSLPGENSFAVALAT